MIVIRDRLYNWSIASFRTWFESRKKVYQSSVAEDMRFGCIQNERQLQSNRFMSRASLSFIYPQKRRTHAKSKMPPHTGKEVATRLHLHAHAIKCSVSPLYCMHKLVTSSMNMNIMMPTPITFTLTCTAHCPSLPQHDYAEHVMNCLPACLSSQKCAKDKTAATDAGFQMITVTPHLICAS